MGKMKESPPAPPCHFLSALAAAAADIRSENKLEGQLCVCGQEQVKVLSELSSSRAKEKQRGPQLAK